MREGCDSADETFQHGRRSGDQALAANLDPSDLVPLAEIRSIPPTEGWFVRLVDDLVEASWTCC